MPVESRYVPRAAIALEFSRRIEDLEEPLRRRERRLRGGPHLRELLQWLEQPENESEKCKKRRARHGGAPQHLPGADPQNEHSDDGSDDLGHRRRQQCKASQLETAPRVLVASLGESAFLV